LFSLFDGAGQRAEPPPTPQAGIRSMMLRIWPRIRNNFERNPLLPLLGFGRPVPQTNLQIQVFICSPLDQSQRQIVDDMYLDIRDRILSRWQAGIAEE